MKELSIEEKAKAYDEAKIKGSRLWECGEITRENYEYIFPELKESEDERIKKALIEHVKGIYKGCCTEEAGKERDMFLAWLEKQGKQKPADKVEPKFNEGDWVIDKQGIVHQISNVIENVTNHTYCYNIVGGGYFNDNTEGIRLWTIKDAKDGDVLATEDNCICIFDNTVEEGKYPFAYCGLSMYGFKVYDRTLPFTHDNVYPATKEQHDLLFQKMKEAGYEWDAEKKELKKIEQKPVTHKYNVGATIYYKSIGGIKSMVVANVIDTGDGNPMYEDADGNDVFEKDLILQMHVEEQESAWSEEDEKVTKWVIDYIGNCPNESFDFYGGVGKEAVLSWLNKLKDILQPQPKQEWKQENTGDLTGFENAMMHIGESFFGKHAGLDPNDTNAIKEQANLLLELVPKHEWSEDGEAFYNKTIGLLKQYASDNEVRKQSAMSCINWLKSAIKHEKIAKYKIGDRVRFFSHAPIFTITGIDEANERYISQSGGFISFYEELIPAKGSLNKDNIKCGDYLTTEDGTVIKVHDIDENECVHHFYYASKMTEDGGDISNNFMYYCAILSDCRRSTQEEINFLEKWVAHKKYVWVKNNVSPYDEEED